MHASIISREPIVPREGVAFIGVSTHPIAIMLQRPLACDLSLSCPESIAIPARHVAVTKTGIIPSAETKGFARHRDTDVHATHAGFNAGNHAPRDVATTRVDTARVSVWTRVLNFNCALNAT